MDAYERRKLAAGILVTILLLILMIGEGMRDRAIRFWLGVIVCSVCALGVLVWLLVSPVLARDPDGRYANSPHHEWYESQYNSMGQWCCNEADGHPYEGDYTINSDGSVTVEYQGEKIRIDASKVLTGPNPTGHAVWWYTLGYNGVNSWCFMPNGGV